MTSSNTVNDQPIPFNSVSDGKNDPFNLNSTNPTCQSQQSTVDKNTHPTNDVSSLFGNTDTSSLFFSPSYQQQQGIHQTSDQTTSSNLQEQQYQQQNVYEPPSQSLSQQQFPVTNSFSSQYQDGTQYQPSSLQQDTTQVYGHQYQQQQQQQQQTEQQWQQFDPNIHYYYDEQGQYHYYDPNTGQEYDYSQYTYDSNNYNSYDPQYYNSQQYNPDPFNLQSESSGTAPITANNMDNDISTTTQTQQYSQEQQQQHISSTVEVTANITTTVTSIHQVGQGDSLDYSIPSAPQETVDITQVEEQKQINHDIANTNQVESVAYESSTQVHNNDITGNGISNSINYSVEERKASIPLIKSTSQQWDQVDVNDQQNLNDQSIINSTSQVTTITTTSITNDNSGNVMNDLTDDLDDLILGDKQSSVLQVQPEVNNNNALPDYSNYNATATPPTNTTSVYGPTYFPSGTISRQMSPVENVNAYNGITTNNNINNLSRSGTPKLSGTENTTPLICVNTSCQAKNKQASKFCEECGTPFVVNESRTPTPINNIPISASTSTSLHAQSAYNRAYSPPVQEQGYNQPTFSSVYQQEQQQNNPSLERSVTPTLYNNQRPLTPSNSNSLYSAPYQHRNSIPITTTPLPNSAYDPASYTNTNTSINNTPNNNFTPTMNSHHQQPYVPNPYDVTSTPTANIESTNSLNYSSNLIQQQQASTRLPVSQDPLKRYMGAPLVSFGFGGKLCMMFPRSTQPHYANTNTYGNGYNDNSSNNTTPKRLPGAIQLKSIKDILVNHPLLSKKLDESLLSVSPVLSDPNFSIKNKKKQVIGFMEQRINDFKNETSANPLDLNTKILLWTLVKMMIEHDGSLLDSETSMKYVTSLFQSKTEINNDINSFSVPAYNGQLYDGQLQQNGQTVEDDRSEVVLDKLQNYLEQGDRRGAVIYAMQEDLWSHALVISSCVDRELWQTVVRSFTQRDLAMPASLKQERVYHNITGNRQALRVLYALFSGSGATAMSEFITTDKQQKHTLGNPLQQQPPTPQLEEHELSKWKETLGLILANRTARDFEAITSLGDILIRHGWVYAAHICYILSPQSSIFSGLDTPYVRYTLLGTNQIERYSITEEENILLTELVEFGSSLRSGNSGECLPFLQGYKLVHAWWLADIGLINEASRYCDAIQQCIKSFNKDSPYLHQYLSGKIKELSEYCSESSGKKQARRDMTSWLKPTFKKNTLDSLWGSIEGRFNKFVSGDDTQTQEEPTGRKSTEIMASPFDGTIEPPARSVSAIDFRMQQSTTTQSYFKRFK